MSDNLNIERKSQPSPVPRFSEAPSSSQRSLRFRIGIITLYLLTAASGICFVGSAVSAATGRPSSEAKDLAWAGGATGASPFLYSLGSLIKRRFF